MKRHPPVPKATLTGRFTPTDFSEVLLKLPEGCPIVGGQAVVWWATRYGISVGSKDEDPLTSVDIDFWGSREDLEELARRLDRKVILPHEYEMTVWVGAIPLNINGEKTIAEFLQWNCERLIEAHHRKPYAKLAAQYGFNILTAVPIEKISQVANDASVEEPDRKRLKSFCNVRWPQVSGSA